MKLYGSLTSPYVRKIRILIGEKNLPVEFIAEGPADTAGNVARLNPLGKVPVLLLDDGDVLFDSPLIQEYLDSLSDPPLIPTKGPSRWNALRWHALAQGIMDAAVAWLMETRRTAAQRSSDALAKQTQKIAAALEFAESRCSTPAFLVDNRFSVADIALVCALGYLDLRFDQPWRESHRHLAAWHERMADRPTVAGTIANL